MKIASVDVYPLRLPVQRELRIARGSIGTPESGAPHVYVRVTAEDGTEGWGEARPSPKWSYETLESAVSALRNYLAPVAVGADVSDIAALHEKFDAEIAPGLTTGQPIAKCGLDMAIHDLRGKLLGVNVRELFGRMGGEPVNITWIVSTSSPDEAAAMAREAAAGGHTGLKVKTGHSPERDEEVLQAVKEAAPDMLIWADANSGYTLAQARRAVQACSRIGVQILEQPLPSNDLHGHSKLVGTTDVAIALDEGVWSPRDLMHAIRMGALDTLVIKLSKMAGFHKARQCAEIADAAGIELIGSGLTESPLAFHAAIQMFSAYSVKYADLNGPQFLAGGPAWDQVRVENGASAPLDGPGLGVKLTEEDVRPFVVE